MHHFRQSIGRCTVARPLIHKHHRAPSVSPLPRCPVTCSKRGCSSTGTNKAKREERGERESRKVREEGKRWDKDIKGQEGKKDARRLPPPGQQFSLSVTAGPRWAAAATCIRLHKSEDRFSISLTNKRGSDRPRRSSHPTMQSTRSFASTMPKARPIAISSR